MVARKPYPEMGVTSYFVTKLRNILLLKQLSNVTSYFSQK